MEFKTGQGGGGVLDIKVKRAAIGVNLLIHQGERIIQFVLRHFKKGKVPPDMSPKEVEIVKPVLHLFDARLSFFDPALHFKDMGKRMQRPKISWVDVERVFGIGLSLCVMACLFQRKGHRSKDKPISRNLGRPMLQGLQGGRQLAFFVAAPEQSTGELAIGQKITGPL